MKKALVFLGLVSIALMGCKGNTWSSEQGPTATIKVSQEEAKLYSGITEDDILVSLELEDGSEVKGEITVTSSNSEIATGEVENGQLLVTSISKGSCTLTLKCESYDCSLEFPVTVGRPALESIEFTNVPESIHVGETYQLQLRSTPADGMIGITPPIFMAEDPSIVECTNYQWLIKGLAIGSTIVHLGMSFFPEEGYYGPNMANTQFSIAVVE